MKRVGRLVAAALLAVVIGGGIAALGLFGILPVPFGPLAEARAAAEKARPPVTVMYSVREKIVNLSDPASPRYLKAQVTLEFIDHKAKEPPKGEEVKKQQDDFVKDMAAYAPIIEDKVSSVLSSKTSAELIKPDGKERLKTELMDKLNAAFHGEEKVVNVYLPTFIVQ